MNSGSGPYLVKRKLVSSIMFSIIVMSLVLVAVNSTLAEACFDPTDKGSIEVVLNKPSIVYDLSILDGMTGIVKVEYLWGETAYLYRSHVDERVVVIVSLQRLFPEESAGKYIGVRVESPITYLNETAVRYEASIELRNESIDFETIRGIASDFGWHVDIGNEGGYIRGYLCKTIDDVNATIYMASAHNNTVMANVIVEGYSMEAFNEVNALLSQIFNKDISLEFREHGGNASVPVPEVGGERLREALEYELKWLRELGVISGLDDHDISRIMEVAGPGLAGWNSRIVYYKGEWTPYYMIDGAMLLRVSGCGWDYPLEEIPSEPPSTSGSPVGESTQPQVLGELEKIALPVGIALIVALIVGIVVRRM